MTASKSAFDSPVTGKIATIGECMLELSADNRPVSSGARAMNLLFGGDTLNTAVYMARLGTPVSFVTALGDDSYSDWMIDQWRREGVDCQLVRRCPDRLPGLYMIETDAEGERRFYYWRDQAPARNLFDEESAADALFAQLRTFGWLYLSGITLSLFAEPALERLFGFLAEYRRGGGRVIYDGNFRPKRWPDTRRAQAVYDRMLANTDTALPTFDDEQMLYGDSKPEQTLARLQKAGVTEAVVKMGAAGCLVLSGDNTTFVASQRVEQVVDTTSAGDSFNGGYVAARLAGMDPDRAAGLGHQLAATVIQHRGAIIDPRAMASIRIQGQGGSGTESTGES